MKARITKADVQRAVAGAAAAGFIAREIVIAPNGDIRLRDVADGTPDGREARALAELEKHLGKATR